MAHLVLALFALLVSLTIPSHPTEVFSIAAWRLPVEFSIIILASVYIRAGWASGIHALWTITIALLLILHLLDIGFYLAFDRRFNPVIDWHLLASASNLLLTGFGIPATLATFTSALLCLFILLWVLMRCLNTLHRARSHYPATRKLAALILFIIIATALWEHRVHNSPLSLHTVIWTDFMNRYKDAKASLNASHQLQRVISSTVSISTPNPTFAAFAGKDVIVIFVESYGRNFSEDERLAPIATDTLRSLGDSLDQAAIFSKSAWLQAPITGGQSWLAHATFHSGLTISTQTDYVHLMTSKHASLATLFQQAGWNSVGVHPGIQYDWPIGDWYQYGELYTNTELNFSGKRFGYITMPDQYTLSYFENHIRKKSDQPIMATITLLSSHAPWSQLPEKLDWSVVGDGSIFNGSHRHTRQSSVLDISTLRIQYAKSVQYSLQIIGEYLVQYASDAVIIVLGDHPPAALMGAPDHSGDVPVHVFSNDKALLNRLPSKQWASGLFPDARLAVQTMSSMRQRLTTHFER